MFNFIFLLLIVIGIIGIIYIYKKYQTDIKKDLEKLSNSSTTWSKWQKIVNIEKLDKLEHTFSNFLEKILRRSRVIVLRLDNNLSQSLDVIKKKKNIRNEKHLSFSKITNMSLLKPISTTTKTKKEELMLLDRFISDRNNLESYKNLARFYLNQNEYRNCRHILLEALTINPKDKIISDLFVALYEKVKPKELQNQI